MLVRLGVICAILLIIATPCSMIAATILPIFAFIHRHDPPTAEALLWWTLLTVSLSEILFGLSRRMFDARGLK